MPRASFVSVLDSPLLAVVVPVRRVRPDADVVRERVRDGHLAGVLAVGAPAVVAAGPRLALPPVVLVVVHQVSQLQRLVIGESCAGHVQVLSDALSEPLLLVPIHASPRVLTGRESGAGTPPCDRVAS